MALPAQRVMERIETLAGFSEEREILLRRSYTDAMRQANAAVAAWMEAAGMVVRHDPAGNLIGRYAAPDQPRTLVLGSHLDTVRDAGKYDGPLGILVALACVESLHERDEHPPFAIEIVVFADEEGLRFGSSYLGSKAVAGTFDRASLNLCDRDGITVEQAMRRFGADPSRLEQCRRNPGEVLGYCEVHIEQGPVLETRGLPVGVVTAIAGQSRFTVSFIGEAGHAGTVPMTLRHDALCAAAEFVLAVETRARQQPGLVATVGQLTVEPGASNVIPGSVTLSLDVRHADDAEREAACAFLHAQAKTIAAQRRLRADWWLLQASPSVPCAPDLTGLLERAIEQHALPVCRLPSGAGHDAVAMADLAPVAMLFVRCRDGISHNPAESVAIEDVATAIEVLGRFLDLLARQT